jgi:hypothetical protein
VTEKKKSKPSLSTEFSHNGGSFEKQSSRTRMRGMTQKHERQVRKKNTYGSMTNDASFNLSCPVSAVSPHLSQV